MREKVSCIIPAFNESENISNLLKTLIHVDRIGEIIVVDDFSADNTKELSGKFKNVRVYQNNKNEGKTYCLLKGINLSKHNLVLLLDADLKGLAKKDILGLLKPVITKKADMALSWRSNNLFGYDLLCKTFKIDILTGERVFNKRLFNFKEFKGIKGFGFEIFFNKLIIKNRLKIKVVKWKKVSSPRPYKKRGFVRGLSKDVNEIYEVLSTGGIISFIYQFFKMSRLSK